MGRCKAEEEAKTTKYAPTTTTFHLDGPPMGMLPKPAVIEEEDEMQTTTPTAELLQYHHRFGHVSFAKLQNMAK